MYCTTRRAVTRRSGSWRSVLSIWRRWFSTLIPSWSHRKTVPMATILLANRIGIDRLRTRRPKRSTVRLFWRSTTCSSARWTRRRTTTRGPWWRGVNLLRFWSRFFRSCHVRRGRWRRRPTRRNLSFSIRWGWWSWLHGSMTRLIYRIMRLFFRQLSTTLDNGKF